ncbi:expressed unknown protein [Seminavis robusta]|uniref:Uncharacterized protein n=1 Tax=Seminavis robusta TaxID=568900 RepID=A0A9N8F348_9STRA|nr:expressed unknown protein [Seminavis robusta]|eukprot:Sro2880_g339210.1 n/a (245) ;mRNA; r:928-1662
MRHSLSFDLLVLSWIASTAHGFGIFSKSPSKPATNFAKAPQSKLTFLQSLETLDTMNAATKERTQMVRDMTNDNPTSQPGSKEGFQPFAAGLWSVIYAPHITTMSKLVGRGFTPVWYDLKQDGTMISHARFDVKLPLLPEKSGWLSVSGTYGTQDDNRVCRVDFDKAWIKWNDDNNNTEDAPYPTLEDVAPSLEKTIIQTLGKWLFIDSFSVFPVSYLDDDLIVFDFELLGTRICARKIKKETP